MRRSGSAVWVLGAALASSGLGCNNGDSYMVPNGPVGQGNLSMRRVVVEKPPEAPVAEEPPFAPEVVATTPGTSASGTAGPGIAAPGTATPPAPAQGTGGAGASTAGGAASVPAVAGATVTTPRPVRRAAPASRPAPHAVTADDYYPVDLPFSNGGTQRVWVRKPN